MHRSSDPQAEPARRHRAAAAAGGLQRAGDLRHPQGRAPGAGRSGSRSSPRMRAASSSAWCGRATRPISASASPARSIARIVNVGDACMPATWWRSSIRRTSICRSRARRPSSPPPPRISPRPRPRKPATPTSRPAARVAIADYDHKKAAKDEAEGRLERARRALDLARNQLAYAELKADVDGVITATLAEPGQVVALGQPVARLAHHGEMEAVVALPETWLGEARKAARHGAVVVGSRAAASRPVCASSRRRPTPTTRTYAARFTIEDPDDAVALGMTATVTLSHAAPRRSPGCRSPPSSTAAPAPPSMWSTQLGRARAAAGDGRVLHRERGAGQRRRRRTATASSRSACRSSSPGEQVRAVGIALIGRRGRQAATKESAS